MGLLLFLIIERLPAMTASLGRWWGLSARRWSTASGQALPTASASR